MCSSPSFCGHIINDRLQVHTHASVAQLPRIGQGQRLPLAVRIVPDNLLGALWLQFALAMSGERHRRCEQCGRWFAVKPRGRRAKLRYQR